MHRPFIIRYILLFVRDIYVTCQGIYIYMYFVQHYKDTINKIQLFLSINVQGRLNMDNNYHAICIITPLNN